MVVWKGSRGFAGKTTLLGHLSHLELLLGVNVNVLGGSLEQSQRVHATSTHAWEYKPIHNGKEHISPFTSIVPNKPTAKYTNTIYGTRLSAGAASTKSARGPHPPRLRLDEVDEMPMDVYTSSLGQTMFDMKRNVRAQTAISSTHQYTDGVMTYVLKEAESKGWPVFEWCYKESHVDNGGWLTQEEIDDKRATVPEQMWTVEYDLQLPNAEGRIFKEADIEAMFPPYLPKLENFVYGSRYTFEEFDPDGLYATGCDWGKDRDWTEIITLRYDCEPMRVVCYERVQHESYKLMAKRFENRVRRFFGQSAHDATGVGNAVNDFLNIPGLLDYKTRSKADLFMGLVVAIQEHEIVSPNIPLFKAALETLRNKDIFGSGHAPDGVVALALALMSIVESGGRKGPGKMGEIIILPKSPEIATSFAISDVRRSLKIISTPDWELDVL